MPGVVRVIAKKSRVSGSASEKASGSGNRAKAALILRRALAVRAETNAVIREARAHLSDPFAGLTGAARRRAVRRAQGRISAARMRRAVGTVLSLHRPRGVA